jgi:hypothetical protein
MTALMWCGIRIFRFFVKPLFRLSQLLGREIPHHHEVKIGPISRNRAYLMRYRLSLRLSLPISVVHIGHTNLHSEIRGPGKKSEELPAKQAAREDRKRSMN